MNNVQYFSCLSYLKSTALPFLLIIATLVLQSCATQPTTTEPPASAPPTKNSSEKTSSYETKPALYPGLSKSLQLSEHDAMLVAQQIWVNEGAGKVENLTSWNQNETFASLGIGHFIWYPKGQNPPFEETFPELLIFLQQQRIALPKWLQKPEVDCPWINQAAFLNDFYSDRMVELRTLLQNTFPQQAQFMIKRLENGLQAILASPSLSDSERQRLYEQLNRIISMKPFGIYVLVDYVNFKGTGLSPSERYNNQGWGLLQVLQNMTGRSKNPFAEFADAAAHVLTKRVNNAPAGRNETRWLEGWKKRVNTYRM